MRLFIDTEEPLKQAAASASKLAPHLEAKRLNADEFAKSLVPILTVFVFEGLSQAKMVDRLNQPDSQHKPRLGGEKWELIQLQRVLKRLRALDIPLKGNDWGSW